jgi:hypothetical protein
MQQNIVELLRSIPNILTRSPIARRSPITSYGYGYEMKMEREMRMVNNGRGEAVDLPRCVSDAN